MRCITNTRQSKDLLSTSVNLLVQSFTSSSQVSGPQKVTNEPFCRLCSPLTFSRCLSGESPYSLCLPTLPGAAASPSSKSAVRPYLALSYKSRIPKGKWGAGGRRAKGQRGSNGDRRSISLSDSVVIVWSYSGESAAAPALDIACLDFPRACCCWVRSLSRCLPLYLSAVCPPPVSLPHLQQENKQGLLPVDFFSYFFLQHEEGCAFRTRQKAAEIYAAGFEGDILMCYLIVHQGKKETVLNWMLAEWNIIGIWK